MVHTDDTCEDIFELFNTSNSTISQSLTTVTALELDLNTSSSYSRTCTSPLAISTPTTDMPTAIDWFRSDQEIANAFFQTIEQLVRNFVNRPNCLFPYYRVMRWTNDSMEHFVTVIINRPTLF